MGRKPKRRTRHRLLGTAVTVSLKAAEDWHYGTLNNRPVTLVGTPDIGDRYFLFVAWKDYTTQIDQLYNSGLFRNFVSLGEYADGTVSSGVGVGSVKVCCYYCDWQAGDEDLNMHFTASPAIAIWNLQLWTKAASDTWDTPLAFTAPWPDQNTGTISATASASAGQIKDGSAVMNMIALRDDCATFTMPTNGIDVASGITWNGNRVQAPTDHIATGGGQDMSGNTGYRLVTTGNSGAVTLRATVSSLTTTESGSSLWVVQSVTPGAPQEDHSAGMFLVV